LDEIGLMRQAHADALAGCANALAIAISADAILRRDGLLVRSGETVRLHPAYSASLRSWESFRRFASEFGLSPKAAAQLAAPEGAQPKTLEDILSEPVALPDLSDILGKAN
jgi:phage terminase small subunit